MGFRDGLKICMCFFLSESWNNFYFFRIFNFDTFLVLILQKRIGSRYLVPVTPTTVFSRSFWNFTGGLRMVWRYACIFFRILKLFFISGFLLQYLSKGYRTNAPLVSLPIFNTSNKNKAGDINSSWNLLVIISYVILLLLKILIHYLKYYLLCLNVTCRSVLKVHNGNERNHSLFSVSFLVVITKP